MRILVTGAAGFIGSHVAEALLARGDAMVGLDNFNDYYDPARKHANAAAFREHPACTFYEGDIRDLEALEALFERERPAAVIHLAAMAAVRYSVKHPLLYEDVNVRGTLYLLEMARRYDVQKFVLASTSSVYGATTKIPFQEDDPTDKPLAAYPATKKACELLAHAYHHLHGLSVAVLRFFNVYGPRGRPDMTPYTFTESILQGRPITLFAEGTPHRDWTYIQDTRAGILAALDTPLGYEIFNLGCSRPVVMRRFVELIEEYTGRRAIIEHAPLPPSDPMVTYADVSKARRMLGYEPTVQLEEGMRRFVDWFTGC
ncbi:MAG: GDP-mannose 4,6-dehydratase [Chloroflexi bacterium]|nr:GDP-mannose 4,6-dehydratase [Chloroflexota bacterium]MBU1751158.1 GDP-mannose 4,6-dehydratase [Chloroflexota bacterium]